MHFPIIESTFQLFFIHTTLSGLFHISVIIYMDLLYHYYHCHYRFYHSFIL